MITEGQSTKPTSTEQKANLTEKELLRYAKTREARIAIRKLCRLSKIPRE